MRAALDTHCPVFGNLQRQNNRYHVRIHTSDHSAHLQNPVLAHLKTPGLKSFCFCLRNAALQADPAAFALCGSRCSRAVTAWFLRLRTPF